MFSSASTLSQQAIQPAYVETINTPYIVSNGTYQDIDKYYNFVYINKVYMLEEGLDGYIEYKRKVKYRMIPFIW